MSVFGLFLARIFPYSVRMGENTDQKKSEYEHFSRSATIVVFQWNPHLNRWDTYVWNSYILTSCIFVSKNVFTSIWKRIKNVHRRSPYGTKQVLTGFDTISVFIQVWSWSHWSDWYDIARTKEITLRRWIHVVQWHL